MGGRLSPHRGCPDTPGLKIPPWADASQHRARIPLGLAPRPSQRGHDDYQNAAPDTAAMLSFRDRPRAPGAAVRVSFADYEAVGMSS